METSREIRKETEACSSGEKTRSEEGHIGNESNCPRLLIIGAGARGNAYARAVTESTNGIIAAVAEPIAYKRETLWKNYIRDGSERTEGQLFTGWEDFYKFECQRRKLAEAGQDVSPGVDGVFICTLDEMHAEIIAGLAPLGLAIMSEKPLATSLEDCLKIYRCLEAAKLQAIFAIGHVLRYSPHNMLLRRLLLEEDVIGDVLSVEHTEPVGWWHFAHSYVRGNWRKESMTAPSLLTKSCHDIDLILWLLCSPPPSRLKDPPHLPAFVSSTGSVTYHKKSHKPPLAGTATNCLSCPAEIECIYSAKKIYFERHLSKGDAKWPVHIVDPEIEDSLTTTGMPAAKAKLMERLAENYDNCTPQAEIDRRPWYGRCVYESDNDVCDDQIVTITFEEEPLAPQSGIDLPARLKGRGAKTATFHMVAFTEKRCERRGRIYGTKGEIEYDSKTIKAYYFANGHTRVHHPHQPGGGHGGGDDGLAQQYVKAIDAVKNAGMSVEEAQRAHIGCTLEEVIRSHAMVFAAEEARRRRKVVDWKDWWHSNVQTALEQS